MELQSREKKELSINIDARPCDMAPGGNNIFPRTISVNVKEASGTFHFRFPYNEPRNLHSCALACILILHSELKEAIIFRLKMTQKIFFTEKPFLNGKFIFHVPLHPFQGAKVDCGPKLSLWQSNK